MITSSSSVKLVSSSVKGVLPSLGAYGTKAGSASKEGEFATITNGHGQPPAEMSVWAEPLAHEVDGLAKWGPGRPLRVIHVGPCLYRGGAEMWLVQLDSSLNPAHLCVEETILLRPEMHDPEFVKGLPIRCRPGDAAAVREAAARADVVLAWGVALDEWLGTTTKLPALCIGIAHGEGEFTREQLAGSRFQLDHVIAVSEAARRGACEGLGLPSSVVPNGIDTARLAWSAPRDATRAALGFRPGDFVVGYVGRFSPEKRVHLVLEAIAAAPAGVKGLFVGWGPLLPDLLEAANRLAPGRCVVRTATDRLGDFYRALDAFCSPSESEGTPLTMLEAMFCGVPVVMTSVGAVPELIVNRVNGQIVEPCLESIEAALARLRAHPAWARGLAEEARATADGHGHAAAMARGYERVIGRLWMERLHAASTTAQAQAP